MRDDFSQRTKDTLGRRVNFLCSQPECRVATVGPHSESSGSVNRGVAAHITAAAPGGKRFDAQLTEEKRKSVENGIWLCQNCAKLIDSDENRFTTALLRDWKVVAEARVDRSLQTNTPLSVSRDGSDLRVRASYTGGADRALIHLSMFNAGPSPIYLSGWCAEWGGGDERGSALRSVNCVSGKLPYRLPDQDTHSVVVDLGRRSFVTLKTVGILDGSDRCWQASRTEIAAMAQHAERYGILHSQGDNQERESKLLECEVAIECTVETLLNDRKELTVTFINKSAIPIQLREAEISWHYSPPRSQPRGPESRATAVETGGSVSLGCRSDLASPVPPGGTVVFFVRPEMAGVLVETILGDVKEGGIVITVSSDTRVAWREQNDNISGGVQEFARLVVDAQSTL